VAVSKNNFETIVDTKCIYSLYLCFGYAYSHNGYEKCSDIHIMYYAYGARFIQKKNKKW
jgi:hypothetical protein